MAYSLFLIDPNDSDTSFEMDVEDVDFSTTFSISTIEDISKRKDNITKTIALKGSAQNNLAFGSLFHQNVVSDSTLTNRLGFNYSPIKSVTCLIYEDGALILRGQIRVLEITADKDGNVTYSTVVTGTFIDLRMVLSEKLLTDLDLRDMKHEFKYSTVKESWATRTQNYNSVTSGFTFSAFNKGQKYVYPMIEYGNLFKQTNASANVNVNIFNAANYRPAVYVNEYFKRIFGQPELSGYTYEIRGSQDFKDRFNSLIIPNNEDTLKTKLSGFKLAFEKSIVTVENHLSPATSVPSIATTFFRYKLLQFNFFPTPPANTVNPFITRFPNGFGILNINKTFRSDARAYVDFTNFFNGHVFEIFVHLAVVERDFSTNPSPIEGWNTLYTKKFSLQPNTGTGGARTITIDVPQRDWLANKQVGLMLVVENTVQSYFFGNNLRNVTFDIFKHGISFPKDTNSTIELEVAINDNNLITPVAPANIKQLDFMKSVITMNNLYVYSEKENPKKLIFEPYNDYYALTSQNLLASTAINWTKKIDYNSGFKIKSNLDLPKSYSFSYKTDGDYLNTEYVKNYNEPYGSYKFNDTLGLVAEKKVEVIFSPTPLLKENGSGRIVSGIYTIDGTNKKPIKSNIRMIYYNGEKNVLPVYNVSKDGLVGGIYSVQTIESNITKYPQAGHYYLASGVADTTALHELNFGVPKQLYFNYTSDHVNAPTSYQDYYRQQVSNFTNPNVNILECNVWLNEVDISNLNLKVPVFIDLGDKGHAYFRIIEVEYVNNLTMSRCILQKIVI